MDFREIQGLLARLGLTEYESKTLTSLLRLNEAKAPDISREAQVPKTRVYDVLDSLVAKDLIIEIQGRPKRYRAREPDKVFSELLNSKKQEIRELENETASLQAKIGSVFSEDEVGEKVLKVKEPQDFVRILAQEISKAKSSVIAFTEITPKQAVLRNAIAQAKANKVNVKMLHALDETDISKIKELGVELKKSKHGLEAFIIDGKKLVMALSDFSKAQPEYHFAIWTDAPIIGPLNDHFSKLWNAK
ncbi:MAG: helix-turn-helix domain-containing protein [Candidatus Diapherotrites archaeon]